MNVTDDDKKPYQVLELASLKYVCHRCSQGTKLDSGVEFDAFGGWELDKVGVMLQSRQEIHGLEEAENRSIEHCSNPKSSHKCRYEKSWPCVTTLKADDNLSLSETKDCAPADEMECRCVS